MKSERLLRRPCCPYSRRAERCGAGGRQCADPLDTGFTQQQAARLQRRARRHHVIDEDHAPGSTRDHAGPPSLQGVGIPDVGLPEVGAQPGLWHTQRPAPQRSPHREAKLARQFLRLIEPPPQAPPWMKRHRHNGVCACQQAVISLPHEETQRRAQRLEPPVLERMDDLSQGTFVQSECPRPIEMRRMRAAPHATGCAPGALPPGCQRFAAPVTPGRADHSNAAPALAADRADPSRAQWAQTGRARRREERVKGLIGPLDDGHRRNVSKNPASRQPESRQGFVRGSRARCRSCDAREPIRAQKLRSARHRPRAVPARRTTGASAERHGR